MDTFGMNPIKKRVHRTKAELKQNLKQVRLYENTS